MLVKCNCNNCSAHLEFDSASAGTVIVCPKCGIETQLYVPVNPSNQQLPKSNKLKRDNLKFGIITAGGVMVVGLVSLLIIYWHQIIHPLAEVLGGTAAAVVGTVLALAVIVWAVLWIVFPVFVYYQLNELIKLQRLIERNTRR